MHLHGPQQMGGVMRLKTISFHLNTLVEFSLPGELGGKRLRVFADLSAVIQTQGPKLHWVVFF